MGNPARRLSFESPPDQWRTLPASKEGESSKETLALWQSESNRCSITARSATRTSPIWKLGIVANYPATRRTASIDDPGAIEKRTALRVNPTEASRRFIATAKFHAGACGLAQHLLALHSGGTTDKCGLPSRLFNFETAMRRSLLCRGKLCSLKFMPRPLA